MQGVEGVRGDEFCTQTSWGFKGGRLRHAGEVAACERKAREHQQHMHLLHHTSLLLVTFMYFGT